MYPISHRHRTLPSSEVAAQPATKARAPAGAPAEHSADRVTLSREGRQQLAVLQARDREVRSHEQAHLSAAGGLARGGPTFEYTRGPDNRLYAVGGEVQIDTQAHADDPEATLEKAAQIRRAALAPANPSSQDLQVAAQATQMAAQARQEIASERTQDDSQATCGACGGAHASAAHEGIAAYQAADG